MSKKRGRKKELGIYGQTNSQYFINYFSNIAPIEKEQIIEMVGYSPQLAYVVLKWAVGSGVIVKSYLVPDKEFNYLQGTNFGFEEYEQKVFSQSSKKHVVARRTIFLEMRLDKMPPRKSSLKKYNDFDHGLIQIYPVLDFLMEKLKQSGDMKKYLFNLAKKQGLIVYDSETGKWHGKDYGL
nr:MAG TPA: hypothetical protein [Caudoviricetes sp.]